MFVDLQVLEAERSKEEQLSQWWWITVHFIKAWQVKFFFFFSDFTNVHL